MPTILGTVRKSKPHQTGSAVYSGRMSRSVARANPAGLSQRLVRSTSAVSLPEQARCYRQISEKTHDGSGPSGEVRLHKAVAIGLFLGSSYSFTVMRLVPRGRADILREKPGDRRKAVPIWVGEQLKLLQ